ncbi:hypothetical protein BKA60DRAFT_488360 [Fusarium oxysporum]|nr:hypothetical protein BKA60DRAFT_488360 [Fusarium oxysporum]
MESGSIEAGYVSLPAYITNLSINAPSLKELSLTEAEPKNGDRRDLPIIELSRVFAELHVPGPFDFIFDKGEVASGAQFIVRQATIVPPDDSRQLILAAIKYPRFLLNARIKLDLSSDSIRRQVYDLIIEIAALRHPALRDHPNIVHMIGWGVDITWHRVPFIALELANGDLEKFIQDDVPMTFRNRQAIILDISSALWAIHDVGIIHGDLKPGNVLIYEKDARWLARLTDFGGGAGIIGTNSLRGRGTVGWRAPELRLYHENGEPLDPEYLDSIDMYSFGLITWFTLCQTTSPPEGSEGDRALELALQDFRNKSDIPEALKDKFCQLTEACLTKDAKERDTAVVRLLGSKDGKAAVVNKDHQADTHRGTRSDGDTEEGVADLEFQADAVDNYSPWDWQIPVFSDAMANYLLSAYCQNENSLSAEEVFGLFMNSQDLINKRLLDPVTKDTWLGLLRKAALSGVIQAQGLIFSYYDRYGFQPDDEIQVHRQDWLFSSIATGALASSIKARSTDPSRFDNAIKIFQRNGGFNQHFTLMKPSTLDDLIDFDLEIIREGVSTTRALNKDGDCLIHALCSFNSPTALKILRRITSSTNVNSLNYLGEFPLYRAFLCGSLETVLFLLHEGADPTIQSRGDGPSCLHWLFAFHPDQITAVTDAIVKNGALVNALSTRDHKMLHYPFVTPVGSPLHWAVEFSSAEAVKALLRHGADPWLPNGHKQFILSTGIAFFCPRSLDDVLPEEPILGASGGPSAVEIAVQNWDHGILQLLLENNSRGGTQILEDGIGVFHHLIAGDFRWIGTQNQFYNPVMRGPRSLDRAKIRNTVDTLLRYGFDINQLSVSWIPFPFDRQITNTCLMLAIYVGNLEMAEELIEAGADVNIAGNDKRTALMGFGPNYTQNEDLQIRAIKLLLAHGARIDVRDENGFTPVLAQAHSVRTFAVEVLLDNGASISDKPEKPNWSLEEGEYPLFNMLCSGRQDKQLARILRKHAVMALDAIAATQTASRRTLLHYAVEYELFESTQVLLEAGVEVNPIYKNRPSASGREMPPETPLDSLLKSWPLSLERAREKMSKSEVLEYEEKLTNLLDLLKSYGSCKASEIEP